MKMIPTWLPFMLELSLSLPCVFATEILNTRAKQDYLMTHNRIKRGWMWNQFLVLEEQELKEPLYIGQLRSDIDIHDGTFKYLLSGEGANTVFTIDEKTGAIYLLKKLDREEKPSYKLRAQVINGFTGVPIETESEFIIKIQDINDNEPKFIKEPYMTTIPEMSPEGTFVMQVTATDKDDPSYGNSARLIYSILHGQPHFSIEPKSGIIRVSSPMDREAKDQYFVTIQAKDIVGNDGGLSTTTTVTITLSDVNDNPPKFQQKIYDMSIIETALVGEIVGTIIADDRDIGKNAEMIYVIEEKGDFSMFEIITDDITQEGIITLRKVIDYETKRRYNIRVRAINKYIDERFIKKELSQDYTTIRINVEDVDEPPVFSQHEYYMEVLENASVGSYVDSVTAKDPDITQNSIRYGILKKYSRFFDIDAHNGSITVIKPLDRETTKWHNITIAATETKTQVSKIPVYIHVIDVNDHPPEFSRKYDIYVCEGSKPGQPIQTVSAVDKDDPAFGHYFSYFSFPEATNDANFTVRDNRDNTATILTGRKGFNYEDNPLFYLTVIISDNGTPSLSSTNTLTISVCDCGVNGNTESCKAQGFLSSLGLNGGALIAISIGAFLLLVLSILILVKQRKKALLEKGEDFKQNFVKYDDEGGGEEDTESFDIIGLRNRAVMREPKFNRKIKRDIPSLYRMSLRLGPDVDIFREFLVEKLEETNTDVNALPLDTLHIYAFEGTGSMSGSLSSIDSICSDTEPCYKMQEISG
ncbi:cadherin-19 isoform X1 [Pelobates cultripes]|uniref:Cadherin-19 isoform X1 n=1 Tax=Pelobates cultripes TaxID=61616 RepID=A0AAD1W5Z8_PELCU|nr:cadherin-19 isoform X1 [Pelobates cultripes]